MIDTLVEDVLKMLLPVLNKACDSAAISYLDGVEIAQPIVAALVQRLRETGQEDELIRDMLIRGH